MVSLPSLLVEIVRQAIEEQGDMEVVARFDDLDDVLFDAWSIDALITSIEQSRMYELKTLFARYPEMIVVNLSRSADAGELLRLEITRLALDDLSPKRVIEVTRRALGITHGY